MSRYLDKEKAIKLRLEGRSYSEIKSLIGISKSTLSGWLHDYPLSNERLRELRDFSQKRIESFRITMQKKQDDYSEESYWKVSSEIGKISNRELFISGFFLYWAEGGKTQRYSVDLTNTNPNMLIFFIKWLKLLGVESSKLKVKLHLYSDMDIKTELLFWRKKLELKESQFRKPYIKKSRLSDLTYKNGYGHGTCCITYGGKDVSRKIHMGIKHLNGIYN